MKMTKSDLKAIVKECLLEILNEGLGGMQKNVSNFSMGSTQQSLEIPVKKPAFVETRQTRPAPSHDRKMSPGLPVRESHRREPSNMMESIFADTASTTLKNQISHGDTNPVGSSSRQGITQQEQISGTPEQIFGEEIASKWANLAFAEPAVKK